ncbi:MAG: outer membrane beta-barrel protein [Gemmatimonas sp.]|nr:outer membrane beta-barrel protein [Gemmatimonas sp.]
MKRVFAGAAAALILAVQPLSGQLWEAGLPGDDIGSLAVNFGVLSPTTEFPDDGSSFDQGTGFGMALTYWPSDHFGLRTHVMRGETPGNHGNLAPCPPTPCSAVGYQEPVVWHYSAEAAVRRPMGGAGFAWFPYASAGVTGKSYRWSIDRPRVGYTGGGWTAAGGIEARTGATGPLGFMAEVRTYQTRFQTLGKNQGQSDFALTAGVTLSR